MQCLCEVLLRKLFSIVYISQIFSTETFNILLRYWCIKYGEKIIKSLSPDEWLLLKIIPHLLFARVCIISILGYIALYIWSPYSLLMITLKKKTLFKIPYLDIRKKKDSLVGAIFWFLFFKILEKIDEHKLLQI